MHHNVRLKNFKNHTIAGNSTCKKRFPYVLWYKLIKQAQATLNMLRPLRTHPQLSAYHVLEFTHNFNRVPFALPSCYATIFNPPKTRTSWGPRDLDAWYCGPSYEQYREWKRHIPSTGGIRTSEQATFYPQQCTVPTETQMYEAT